MTDEVQVVCGYTDGRRATRAAIGIARGALSQCASYSMYVCTTLSMYAYVWVCMSARAAFALEAGMNEWDVEWVRSVRAHAEARTGPRDARRGARAVGICSTWIDTRIDTVARGYRRTAVPRAGGIRIHIHTVSYTSDKRTRKPAHVPLKPTLVEGVDMYVCMYGVTLKL